MLWHFQVMVSAAAGIVIMTNVNMHITDSSFLNISGYLLLGLWCLFWKLQGLLGWWNSPA
jgi:hypothetical protein